MKISQANLLHLSPLAELFDAYRVFYRKASDINGAIAYLKERINQKEAIIFIAQEEDEMVGFTLLYPLFSSTNMRRIWLLNDLFVSPQHRGRKISKALIEAAQLHCQATQVHGISLETEKSNLPGNALYPKMGFQKDLDHHFYYWENPIFSSSES